VKLLSLLLFLFIFLISVPFYTPLLETNKFLAKKIDGNINGIDKGFKDLRNKSKPSFSNNLNACLVDSSEHNLKNSVLNGDNENLESTQVLGTVNEKFELLMVIFDGESNKILPNYEIQIEYYYFTHTLKNESNKKNIEILRTNKKGEVIITIPKPGLISLELITKDYLLSVPSFHVSYGQNRETIKLFKGGAIEVFAINSEGKKLNDLKVTIDYKDILYQGHSSLPIDMQHKSSSFVMSNVLAGNPFISFIAKGYQKTPHYKVIIKKNEITQIYIQLQPCKVFLFDIDVKPKPSIVNILPINGVRKKERFLVPDFIVQNAPFGTRTISKAASLSNWKLRKLITKSLDERYEYSVEDQNQSEFRLYVDKFLPQVVELNENNKNIISLTPSYVGELQIKDKEGQPLEGVEVNYLIESFSQTSKSDKEGRVYLNILDEKIKIKFKLSHNDYIPQSIDWDFDLKANNQKTIILKKCFKVNGIVFLNNNPIAGANVILCRNEDDYDSILANVKTDEKGAYRLTNLDLEKDEIYFLSAFHKDFGVFLSEPIKDDNFEQTQNLKLANGTKSTIRIVDGLGKPIPNQVIRLNDRWLLSSHNFKTDKKGEFEVNNSRPGRYQITIMADELKLTVDEIDLPVKNLEVSAIKKRLIKIEAFNEENQKLTELKRVSFEGKGVFVPLNIINEKNIRIFVDSIHEKKNGSGYLFFKFQDYDTLSNGPFDSIIDLPEKLKLNCTSSIKKYAGNKGLKVKVVDSENHPVAFIKVDLLKAGNIIQSMPTNSTGEVQFAQVFDKINLSIKDDLFIDINMEVDLLKSDNKVEVKLFKGGSIKGHITLNNDAYYESWITTNPGNISVYIDKSGFFEFFNLESNDYLFTVTNVMKPERIHEFLKISQSFSLKEEGKLDIDLDNFVNK
jgi:hypothetical protein